jgi:calcineurin-like phosphoesterase family protein
MIKIDTDRKVWITSDTHYGHKNICRGVTSWRLPDGRIPIEKTRDFDTIEQMNEAIVDGINSVVGQDDILIHLGDFSFGGFENIQKFRDRILCKEIHLVLGNHDTSIENNKGNVQELFTSVNHYTRLLYKNKTFVLFHFPISSWDSLNKGHIHLHGHVHLPTNLRFGKGKKMDVGFDGHPTFGVYGMDDIIQIMDKREIASDMLFDHHTDEIINKDKG